MKPIQKLLCATTLALTLSATCLAGDLDTPGKNPPPPPDPGQGRAAVTVTVNLEAVTLDTLAVNAWLIIRNLM